MPTLTATVSSTHEITLKPSVRRKLLTELRTYAELKSQIKVLEAAVDKHKTAISALREETGEQSLSLEGFSVTLVAPVRKKFNPKRFVTLGGDIGIYNEAMENVLSKPYDKISLPSDREDGE